ncbi:MAG: DUF86 domain-containing protein, partial [Candidatus Scalindua sp.]
MERIYQKIGKINEYLKLIRSIKDECMERFTTDFLYRGALLHYLYLLADTCISLGEIVIKHKKLRIPQSYQDVFDILGENKILEPDFAFNFAKIAGFRNFLSHDYEQIDAKHICENILSKLDDVD